METLLYIAASVALLALAGLFIYLILLLKGSKGLLDNVTKAVQGLVGEITALRTSLTGTIKNIEGISGKAEGTLDRLNTSVDRVNSQLDQVEGIVGSVRKMTEDASRVADDATDVIHAAKGVVISLIDLEQNIQYKVQRPVVEILSVFSALGKGIHTFRRKLSGESSNGTAAHIDGTMREPVDGRSSDMIDRPGVTARPQLVE